MQSLRKQCQVQLELEQSVITASLRSANRPGGADDFDRISQEMQQRMLVKLQTIERALKHLNNGQFGLCQLCHEPIAAERLQALPYTTTCIDCQRRIERETLQTSRH